MNALGDGLKFIGVALAVVGVAYFVESAEIPVMIIGVIGFIFAAGSCGN